MGRPNRRNAAPDIAAEVAAVLRETYPDLYLIRDGSRLRVRGTFPVSDDDGTIERFAVEIIVDTDNPDELPVVLPTDPRIPHTMDRHVNHDDTACVGVPEEWLVTRPDASFAAFMAGPVRNFFIGQALKNRGKPWPAGERSHGTAGAVEAFTELVGFTEPDQLRRALRLLAKPYIGGHLPCPCGSGTRLRACHVDTVRAAQARISPAIAKRMLARLDGKN